MAIPRSINGANPAETIKDGAKMADHQNLLLQSDDDELNFSLEDEENELPSLEEIFEDDDNILYEQKATNVDNTANINEDELDELLGLDDDELDDNDDIIIPEGNDFDAESFEEEDSQDQDFDEETVLADPESFTIPSPSATESANDTALFNDDEEDDFVFDDDEEDNDSNTISDNEASSQDDFIFEDDNEENNFIFEDLSDSSETDEEHDLVFDDDSSSDEEGISENEIIEENNNSEEIASSDDILFFDDDEEENDDDENDESSPYDLMFDEYDGEDDGESFEEIMARLNDNSSDESDNGDDNDESSAEDVLLDNDTSDDQELSFDENDEEQFEGFELNPSLTKKDKKAKPAKEAEDEDESSNNSNEKIAKSSNFFDTMKLMWAQITADMRGEDPPKSLPKTSKEDDELEDEADEDEDKPKNKPKGKGKKKGKSLGNPFKRLASSPVGKIFTPFKKSYLWLVKLCFGLINGILGILAKLPLIGKIIQPVLAMTKILEKIAMYLPIVLLILLLVFISYMSVPRSFENAELPDNGAVVINSFDYDDGIASATVNNTGEVILSDIEVSFEVYTLQPELLNPKSWVIPVLANECVSDPVSVDIEGTEEVEVSCEVDEGLLPRVSAKY